MKILLAIPSARYIETECVTSLFEMEKTGDIELFIPKSYSGRCGEKYHCQVRTGERSLTTLCGWIRT